MPDPQNAPATADVCGFHGGAGVVAVDVLRAAVVRNATDERAKWFAGGPYQHEQAAARIGDLGRYWLAGNRGHGDVEPPTLAAAQAAALGPGVNYAPLVGALAKSSVQQFLAADSLVDARATDLLARWDVVDARRPAFEAARKRELETGREAKTAAEAVRRAAELVSDLEGKLKRGEATETSLERERKAFARAVDERKRTADLHQNAKDALAGPRSAFTDAEKERDKARRAYVDAKVVRDGKVDGNGKIIRAGLVTGATSAGVAATKKVVDDLRAVAPPAGVRVIGEARATGAVLEAHKSRAEISAWSAVFVVACVRAAAIAHRLEWMAGTTHEGKNALLLATSRHAEYVIEARERRRPRKRNGVARPPTLGTYHAFEPDERAVRTGDIVATDRVLEITDRVKLKDLDGREMHCDVVTALGAVGATKYAETVGGNVGDTVRRRRYPLDASGRLVVVRERLFAEENDDGSFPALATRSTASTILPAHSTGRVFALLSLVERCVPAAAKEEESPWSDGRIDRLLAEARRPSPWPGPTDGERPMRDAHEQLESPFLDEEIVVGERRSGDESDTADETEEGDRERFEGRGDDEVDPDDEGSPSDDERSPAFSDPAAFLDGETETDLGTDFETDLGTDLEIDPEVNFAEADFETDSEVDLDEAESSFVADSGEDEVELEAEWKDLAAADVADDGVAQTPFAAAVRARLEPLLDGARTRTASAWNAALHPAKSGVDAAAILARLDRYVDRAAAERAMQGSADLRALAADPNAVLAVVAHQFQQKIYASSRSRDGRVGEGTLDAIGLVRHRDGSLNAVDVLNASYHAKGNSKAYQRVKEVYRTDRAAFDALGSDVTPANWYYLFVDAPFLGVPFVKGVHLELMRRLRLAERWLLSLPAYRGMSAAELGAALGIDEEHHGGRTTANNSMHTLGLAVDVGYVRNPWVAGQHDAKGKRLVCWKCDPTIDRARWPRLCRNTKFEDVSRNVSRLLAGTDETLTSRWLSRLGSDPGRTTESAFGEIQLRHARFVEYVGLARQPDRLRTILEGRARGASPEMVIDRNETLDAAVRRWRGIITNDRALLQDALGSNRSAAAGFMNLHRDLVVALRDHGCLAWGAIDLGPNACGDMMHFDCRPSGLGRALSLEMQRTAGANHPCREGARAPVRAQREAFAFEQREAFASEAPAASTNPWTFAAKTLPVRVGVFVPPAVGQARSVEVLVYAHGLLSPCAPAPKKVPYDLIANAPFRLAKLVEASGRAIVLVVPFLDWPNTVPGKLGFGRQGKQHLLAKPANLNAMIDEVLGEVGRVNGTPAPALTNLVVAGHSRAYDFLDPLASAHADPEMSKGALARLTQVWALDTTYTAPVNDWTALIASKPALVVDVFFRCAGGTRDGGLAFDRAAARSGGRLRVTCVCEGHCAVPGRRLPELLSRPTFSAPDAAPSGIAPELELDETFRGDAEHAEWNEAGGDFAELVGDEPEADLEGGHERLVDEETDDDRDEHEADNDEHEDDGDEHEDAEEDEDGEGEAWRSDAEPRPWTPPSARSPAPDGKARVCKDDRCTSAYVRWVQTSLNALLGAKLDVTGTLDAATQQAIRRFKKRRGLKTRQVYAGPAIERALVAAGASSPPAVSKVPCGVASAAQLVPLLEKHRGDIPVALLMGWMEVESGRDLGSLTSICERGYFQLHPDESIRLGLDHDRVSTDAEYSVRGGIALVNLYRRTIDALSAKYGVARGGDAYWRLVKLCHWIPSAARTILAAMEAAKEPDRSWEGIRRFAAAHRDALEANIKRDPLDGIRSVDHTFEQVDAWAAKLRAP